MTDPLLSVLVVTYNHEKFLEQCLKSALSQQINFPIEIVVGEDCSTDRTREIVKHFELAHPEVVKPLYHPVNVGMMPNFHSCLTACKGKYIAFLDGDDYWTDNNKLEKQVNFLEDNPDYVICAHNVDILKNDTLELPLNVFDKAKTFTINDLARGNFLYTASVVFRAKQIDQYPAWFYDSPAGDYVLHMLNAKKGKILYLPDTMAVYRTHKGGTWWGQPMESVLKKWLKVLSLMLTEPFEEQVLKQLKKSHQRTASEYLAFLLENDKPEFKEQFLKLTEEDHELRSEWLDILVNNSKKLKAIDGPYNGLRNSRVRKGLSYLFRQLKMS